MTKEYREIVPDTWPEFRELLWVLSFGGGLVFRGQRDANWTISSTLERAIPTHFKGEEGDKKTKDLFGNFLEDMEYPVFAKFGERVNQYVGPEAAAETLLGRMALMQHHGVPTRLVDFTYSPYVAAFFAVEDARDPEGFCAIWVIDQNWCQEKSAEAVRKKKKLSEKDFPNDVDFSNEDRLLDAVFDLQTPLVAPLRPSQLNQRIASQQGLFLCPGEMNITFMENLRALGEEALPLILSKIVFPAAWRGMILQDLRSMNIGPHTLFPGLDGYARSIKLQLDLDIEAPIINEEVYGYVKPLVKKFRLVEE